MDCAVKYWLGILFACWVAVCYAQDPGRSSDEPSPPHTIIRLPSPEGEDPPQSPQVRFQADSLSIHHPRANANTDWDAETWLSPFLARVGNTQDISELIADGGSGTVPHGFRPWWEQVIQQPIGIDETPLIVGVDSLVRGALTHSPYILAVSTEPQIRQTVLVEEYAEFDWRAFLESSYDDINEPIGNTLTTGNNDDRFQDQTWSGRGGLRRRNAAGGEFEFSQRLGRQQNNSIFLIPQPQGTTRFELSYSQPLLSGAGRAYNENRIVLARIDTNSASDKLVRGIARPSLESHRCVLAAVPGAGPIPAAQEAATRGCCYSRSARRARRR